MKLDQILNTYAITLEHDGLEFRLTPFTTEQLAWWQDTFNLARGDGESLEEFAERRRQAEMDALAKYLRACLVEGKPQRVTAKWVRETIPNAVLADLGEFLVTGRKPAWAGESGN